MKQYWCETSGNVLRKWWGGVGWVGVWWVYGLGEWCWCGGWGWVGSYAFCTWGTFFMAVRWVQIMLHWSWWPPNGTIFRVTGYLCGNSPVTGEFSAKKPVTRGFDAFFDLRLNKRWVNNREAGDLRCYRTHYDVTVIVLQISGIQSHCMGIPRRWWLWGWYSANDVSDLKFLGYCFLKLSRKSMF